MTKRHVYFDNAATTKPHPEVIKKMLPYLSENFGNPSSIHSFGRKTRVAIEEARETVADFINADASEIYFVSGGTEANNFLLFGLPGVDSVERGRKKLISTKVEHHCVLEPLDELSKRGFEVILLDVNNNGALEGATLDDAVIDACSLLSVIHVNNETGTINDIKKFAELAHKAGAFFHSDTVQGFGKIKIDARFLDVDSLAFSSHKINGPKGIGALYARSGTPLSPLLLGGSQERNRRGGTENPAAIIGFAEAIKIASLDMENNYFVVKNLRDHFISGLLQLDNEGIEVNGGEAILPYILSLTLKQSHYNIDAESLLMYLDINGIAASNGAACSSGTLKPSHVIQNMGRSILEVQGTIRFSFGAGNTIEEVDYVLQVLEKMLKKFRKS